MKVEEWSEKEREMAKAGEIDAEGLVERVSEAMESVELLAGWGLLDRVAQMSTGHVGIIAFDGSSERQRAVRNFLRAWTRLVKDARNLRRVALEAPVEAWSGKAPFVGEVKQAIGGLISVSMNLQIAAGAFAQLARHATRHQQELEEKESRRMRGEPEESEGGSRSADETEACINEIEKFLRGLEEDFERRSGEREDSEALGEQGEGGDGR